MATLVGDLRFGLRTLRRHPAFTTIAVASLALGIGANAAIFSLVDQLLLWTVPARDPERLVRMEGGRGGTYPFYREYAKQNQVFSGLAAVSDTDTTGLRPEGAAAVEVGQITWVSGNLFPTLGVGAAAGRVLIDADDIAGAPPVAVLSYDYWQRRFAGDLRVIGQRLAVNGFPLEIVGVAEPGFGGLSPTARLSAFVPLSVVSLANSGATMFTSTGMFWLTEIGRLKPNVSAAQAQASLRVLWPQVVEAVNRTGRPRSYDREPPITLASAAHGNAGGPGQTMDPLTALLMATGLVLLIACANVANLLLARATGRRREMALRSALGAARGRLVRQLLTESLLLAVLGGLCALPVASAAVAGLAGMNLVDRELRFHPNLRVAAFSAAATLLTGLLFGLAPAWRTSRAGLAESMKDVPRLRLGKVVIALQVALSLALLVGAGLFLRTLGNLNRADIGFRKENVVVLDTAPAKLGYQDQRLRQFYDDLLAGARAVPGVRSAALSLMTPMGEWVMSMGISAEGYQPAPGERTGVMGNFVSDGYFSTLGIPMLLGRDFRAQDEPAPKGRAQVCIVNESLARHLFGGSSPLGRHISFADRYTADGALEIVGVVKDAHYEAVRRADPQGILYLPSWSQISERRLLCVRVAGDVAPVIAALRREVHGMDANVPVLHVRTLEEYVNASFEHERLIAWLCAVFAALGLGLASVGLYGVMAHAVTERTREIGVRMALGAQRGDVIGMVLRESLVPVLAGVAAGVVGAVALARLVAGMLYGVAPRDPATIALAAVAMLGVSLAAAALPARRASRVEPMAALRHE